MSTFLRYENLITSQKGFMIIAGTTIYNIQVSHAQDAKAIQNSRFQASLTLGSSSYYRNSCSAEFTKYSGEQFIIVLLIQRRFLNIHP